jgi:predicted RNase H-like nuclease (RuvC/YqgF family)
MTRTATLITLLTVCLFLTTGCEWKNVFEKNGNDDVQANAADDTPVSIEDETNEQITIRQQRDLIDTQKARIAELENNNIILANELLQLQDQVAALELAVESREFQLDAVSSAVDERNELEGEVALLETDMLDLRTKLIDAQTQIVELQEALFLLSPPAPDVDTESFDELELEPVG